MKSVTRRTLLSSLLAAAASAQDRHAALRERLALPAGRISMVLDTDQYNEVDDQFALAYAVRSPEKLDVEAVYAGPFVNARADTPREGMERSYDEILKMLELLGDERLPEATFRGSTRYLESFDDKLESPAALDLVERAMQDREQPLWVVGLGCPTNIAAAMILEPRIIDRIVVLWIGGQLRSSTSATDFNIRQDYHASRTLYDSGVAFVNIPGYLVSEQMRTTVPELEARLAGKSKVADYLVDIVRQYERERRPRLDYPWSKVIWDLATIGFLINPEWVETRIEPSPILQPDITWKLDDDRHPIRVAWHVDRDPIFDDVFRKLAL